MNIDSIVNQRFMLRNLAAANRKKPAKNDIDTTGDKSTFGEKLSAFRQDNAFNKLITPTKETKPDDKLPEDNRLLFSTRLFDSWDSNLSAEEALAKLDLNLTQIGRYTSDSKLDVKEVLAHISAQYVVYKEHISQTGEGKHLDRLNELVENYTKQYAKDFSEVVGGFYESNGMTGERDRIYSSIIESVKSWTKIAENFIAKPDNNFQSLINDAHLNQKSLANELRKEIRKTNITSESSTLSRAARLMKFSNEELHLGEANIGNEEELGVWLGKAALNALSFFRNIDGADRYKDAFLLSVHKKSEQYLDKVDKQLADKAAEYLENNPTKTDNPFNALDRDAVFDVVEVMTSKYEKTHSLSESLEAGKEYGLKTYLSKVSSENVSERYRDSAFWQEIVKTALDSKSPITQQYLWVQRLLDDRVNPWLNVVA